MLDAILYVLWTGMPRRALTKAGFGPWQTVHDRYGEWKRANLYEDIFAACLRLHDQKHGIDFEWQAEDGTYVRSPLGGKENGPNPTDRGKPGMKDHVLTDGRGVPLSVVVTPANVNDDKRLQEVIDNVVVVRPIPTTKAPRRLALDAAFDNAPARGVVFENRYTGHIAPKAGRDPASPPHPGGKARRWVVEQAHAPHDRFRRLVVNWEKTISSRYAFLCLASALMAYRR
jgi:transposase